MSDFGGFLACFWHRNAKKVSIIGKKYPDIECQGGFIKNIGFLFFN
jgi:hypothetical protein